MEGFVRACQAAVSCALWFFFSSYIILLNKELMVDYGFRYPMTVSSIGMVCSFLLSVVCLRTGLVEAKVDISFDFWIKKICPVGLFMALTLWSGNVVYLHLSVSFIQMFKAFTPIVTMVCLYLAGLETPTQLLVASVFVTAAGLCLATVGEIQLTVIGLIGLCASSLFESIRLVITQWLLTGMKMHPVEGLVYTAPACCLWLFAGASILEWPEMHEANAFEIVKSHPFKFMMTGILGFLVNVLAYIAIKLASALTLKVLGAVKSAVLILFSVVFLGEVVTFTQIWGYSISLVGFAWYNQIKLTQIARADPMQPSSPQQPLLSPEDKQASYSLLQDTESGKDSPGRDGQFKVDLPLSPSRSGTLPAIGVVSAANFRG